MPFVFISQDYRQSMHTEADALITKQRNVVVLAWQHIAAEVCLQAGVSA